MPIVLLLYITAYTYLFRHMYTPAETAGPTRISSEYLKEQTTYKHVITFNDAWVNSSEARRAGEATAWRETLATRRR
jgi:hypothetical protein